MTLVAGDLHRSVRRMDSITSKRKLPISAHVMSGIMAFVDSAVIIGSGVILYLLMIYHNPEIAGLYAATVGFVWISTLLLLQFGGLYQFDAITSPLAFTDKLFVAFVTSFLFLFAAAFSLKVTGTLSRLWIGSFAIAACTGTFAARLVISRIATHLADQEVFTRNVIIVGAGEQCRRLVAHLQEHESRFVSVLGIFADGDVADSGEFCGEPVLGSVDEVSSFVREGKIDDVILALPWAAEDQMTAIIDKLRELPVNVHVVSDLIGFRFNFRAPPSHFGTMPIFEVMGRPISGWGVALKAIEDYVIGILVTAVFLPLMLIVAIAIRIDSPGPVLFRQKRLGFNNKTFEIYKFRTMVNAPAPESAGTPQATRNDPRVTRLGRILRRTSIDELPQLFNVLNGTMSLVGPRPHAVDHNEEYAQKIRGYFARHRVKPGMTGWAQVNGLRGETDTDEKMEARVRHDIYYAENWSVLFDLQILAKTAVICVTGRNAY